MTSKASIGGHPVHPMLVSFPIGLWITSFVADVVFYFHRDWPNLLLISKFMIAAGCLGAIAAAIPGPCGPKCNIFDPITGPNATPAFVAAESQPRPRARCSGFTASAT